MCTETDSRGTFRFEGIESGEYLLGYEIWGDAPSNHKPYPTHYYPGVAGRSNAKVITLAPQESLRDLKLTLPTPHTPRKITIKVVMPDGKPPGGNLLQISSQRGLIQNLEGRDHGGVLIFTGYQEREYEFNARYWVDNLMSGGPVFSKRIAKSDPVKLAAGKEDATVELVLRHELLREEDR
jgi:hypothetical protein